MKKIPLFEIPKQHAPIRRELQKAALRVLASHQYILGSEGVHFEREFSRALGSRFTVGVSSGTSALHLALAALEVGPGDGVLTSPFTFIGTTIAAASVGADIQFADVDPVSLTLDPAQVKNRLKSNTKVVLPVHIFGYPADLGPILEIVRKKGLRMVEDAAQSHLAEYHERKVGTWGDIGCFSFYPSKNLGGLGDAGACLTNDSDLDRKLRILRNNGSDPVMRYKHVLKGVNARLDEFQAAFLLVKLKHLKTWTRMRLERARIYRKILTDVPVRLPPPETKDRTHVYHLFVIQTPERDRLKEFLESKGISTGIYYPIPLHLQPAYAHLGYRLGDFPVAEKACQEVLALPLYPELPPTQVEAIGQRIRSFFKK